MTSPFAVFRRRRRPNPPQHVHEVGAVVGDWRVLERVLVATYVVECATCAARQRLSQNQLTRRCRSCLASSAGRHRIGEVLDQFTLLDTRRVGNVREYLARCSCGKEIWRRRERLKNAGHCGCKRVERDKLKAEALRRGYYEREEKRKAGTLEAPPIDSNLPYEDDPVTQILVNGKEGMSLEEIATCWGMTRERVRQIEERALRRLGKRAALIPGLRQAIIDRLEADEAESPAARTERIGGTTGFW